MKKIITYLFAFIVIQIVVSYAVYIIGFMAQGYTFRTVLHQLQAGVLQPNANMLIISSTIYSVLTALLFRWQGWCVMPRTFIQGRHWDVVAWSAVLAFGTIIPSQWLQEQMPPLPDNLTYIYGQLMSKPEGYVAIGLLAPVVEEIVFRGAILATLLGMMKNRWAAIALSAALFALVHMNLAQMPHAFLIGLIIGWMYSRTGSMVPGIVVHFVNNTVAYVTCVLHPGGADLKLADLFGSSAHVILAVAFSLLILLPALYQLQLRMKKG